MGLLDSLFGGNREVPPAPTIDINKLIQDQLKYARPAQYTPQGSLTYDSDGTIRINETPFGKNFREGQEGTATALGQYLAGNVGALKDVPTSVDWSKVDPIMGSDAFSADADKVSNATFDRAMALLRPEWDARDRASSEALVQSGNPAGNERYTIEKNRLAQSRNDAELAAANDAVLAGRTEQSRLQGLAANTRAEQTQRQLTDTGLVGADRDRRLQELGSYLSGAMTPGSSTSAGDFFAPGNVDTLSPALAANNNAMAAWGAQVNKNMQGGGGLNGLFSLGASLIKAAPAFGLS